MKGSSRTSYCSRTSYDRKEKSRKHSPFVCPLHDERWPAMRIYKTNVHRTPNFAGAKAEAVAAEAIKQAMTFMVMMSMLFVLIVGGLSRCDARQVEVERSSG